MEQLKRSYSSEEEEEEEEEVAHRQDIDDHKNAKLSQTLSSKILDKYGIPPNVDKYYCCEGDKNPAMNFTRGLWTTFVFIEMRPSQHQRSLLDATLRTISEKLDREFPPGLAFAPLQRSELGSPVPLHVSLSANIEFSTAQELDTFTKMLQIEVLQKFPAGPFQVSFKPHLRVYDNIERNALFLALDVAENVKTDRIAPLAAIIDESLDFCRRGPDENIGNGPNASQSPAWSFQNAHMSIARSNDNNISRAYNSERYSSPAASTAAFQRYKDKIFHVNKALKSITLDPELIQALDFQCLGIKATKQRANLWIPFPSHD